MTNDTTFPLDDFCKSTLKNIHLTTHSFRRGGAQHKFFYAEVGFSLDAVRADVQAPDRCQLNPGCPSQWQFRPPETDVASSISQQKRLSYEQRLTGLEEKVSKQNDQIIQMSDKIIQMNDQILQMLTPFTSSEAFRNYITSTKPADSLAALLLSSSASILINRSCSSPFLCFN